MSFRNNMMSTINDFYSQDIDEDIVYALYYPTSNSNLIHDERFFVNKTKFLIDDEVKMPTYENYQLEIPFRSLCVLGPNVRVHLGERPSPLLVEHWNRKLDQKIQFRYTDMTQDAPYVVLFPFECLPEERHAINPHTHYRVHSKEFIQTINCPQPEVYDEVKVPAMLKTHRGSGSETVWDISSKDDYDKWMSVLKKGMPHTGVILTEKVQNIKHDYCVQVYINKKAELTWVGANEIILDSDKYWNGALFDLKDQDMIQKKLDYAIKPVARALHNSGYFGWCGIDILEDTDGKHYVIDLNTRVCGSSSLLLTTRTFEARGWTVGLYKTEVSFVKPLGKVISLAEQMTGGEVMIHSAYEKNGTTVCQMAFYNTDKMSCMNFAKSAILQIGSNRDRQPSSFVRY